MKQSKKALLHPLGILFLFLIFSCKNDAPNPDIDSISISKQYAKDKGVLDAKWNVTTGNKKHIYELALKSYFAVVELGDGGLQDFIHTPNFVLIDKKKQIRGIYDGTNDDEILRLVNDIYTLTNSFKE